MSVAPVSISVVVPVFNQEAILPATLPALLALRGAHDIVFVDDGSTDGSAALLAESVRDRENVRVVTHPVNRGRSAARNTGTASSDREVILFLDADIEPHPAALEAHRLRYSDSATVGVLSKDQPRGLTEENPFHRYVRQNAGPGNILASEPLHFKYFIIGYTSIRRRALEEVGGFDEQIGYGEDLDLAFRLWKRWPQGLFREPGAVVHQHGLADLDARVSKLHAFGRNLPALLTKHPDLAAAADLAVVVSPAMKPFLSRPLSTGVRRALHRSPKSVQLFLIRHLLASAVAIGYHEALST